MTEQERTQLCIIASQTAVYAAEIVHLLNAGEEPVNVRLTKGNIENARSMLQAAKAAIEG